MTHPSQQVENNAVAIRTMITALIICDYSLRRILGDTHQGLKLKVKNAMSSIKQVENYFINHPNSTEKHKELFKKQFLSNEILLLTELLETVYHFDEDGIEEIIKAINQNAVEK